MHVKRITTKLFFLSLSIFFSFNSIAQKNVGTAPGKLGIGIKLGSISGISLKKYLGNGKALEFIAGRAYYFGGRYNDDYYFYTHDRRFKGEYYFKDNQYYYDGHKINWYGGVSSSFAFQLNYLVHKNISALPGLTWYYGVGVQLRTVSYRYYYIDPLGRHDDRIVDIGLGLDGVLGLEYTFKDAPLSIFADVNLYMEVFNNPFLFDGQSGIGIRYNFK